MLAGPVRRITSTKTPTISVDKKSTTNGLHNILDADLLELTIKVSQLGKLTEIHPSEELRRIFEIGKQNGQLLERRRCNHRFYCDRQSVGYSNFFWGNCYISTPHIRVKRRRWTLLKISGGRRCREAIDVCQSCRSSSMYDKISKSTNSFNSQNLWQILPDETQNFSWIFTTVFWFRWKPEARGVKNNQVFEKPYSPTQFPKAFEDGNYSGWSINQDYSGLFLYFRILTSIDFWGLIWFLLKPENQGVKNNQVFERLDSPTQFSKIMGTYSGFEKAKLAVFVNQNWLTKYSAQWETTKMWTRKRCFRTKQWKL